MRLITSSGGVCLVLVLTKSLLLLDLIVTSTTQHQIFDEKFDQKPKSVRIEMADLAGRSDTKKTREQAEKERKRRRDDRSGVSHDQM